MAAIPIPGVSTPVYQSWGKSVADRLNNPSGFHVYRQGPGAISQNAWVPVGFNDPDEIRDVGGWHTQTAAGKFTCPDSGNYFIAGSVVWDANVNGLRNLGFTIAGNWPYVGSTIGPGIATQIWQSFSGVMPVTQGQQLELNVYQNCGGNLNINYYRFMAFKVFELP